VNNCGFVSYLDGEWPTILDNALLELWGMYHSSNCARIDDKLEHPRFMEEISEKNKKIEKKHLALLGDVRKFTNYTEKRVMHENFHKLKAGVREEEEMEKLKNELGVLKEKMEECEAERDERRRRRRRRLNTCSLICSKWFIKQRLVKKDLPNNEGGEEEG
jgi:hypothetical protein